MIILSIALFVSGYFVSANFLLKPISDIEFEFYEQVAHDVYEQGNKAIYEVPDGLILGKTSTSIIISSAKATCRGKVIATLQNGELVCKRSIESAEAILIHSLVGIIFFLLGIAVRVFIFEKKNKRN